MTNKVNLDLGNRSYDIIIDSGAVNQLQDFLQNSNYSKIFVISDENVAHNHLEELTNVLDKVDVVTQTVIVKPGEQAKSFSNLEEICENILQKGVDRKSLIIAFGGGVVGDLSGFVASILLRGIDFIQIPTTLLAAVDSSVGGKTAINSKFGKNLIGSFYQPKLVICDLNFIKTLPQRQIRAGYAEVVKYGFIQDREFFDYLKHNFSKVFACDEEVLKEIISKSCQVKSDIVAQDEKEGGIRALLNLGHTFGHIFETETGYGDELLHGEAVALGTLMAARMSVNFGMIAEADFNEIRVHLEECGFVVDPMKLRDSWDMERLTSHVFKDKKTEKGNLTFILLNKIGDAVVKKGVKLVDFEAVLDEFVD